MKASLEVESVLTNLVHTVINHQSKVDAMWYDNTIKALDNLKLIPDQFVGDTKTALLQAMFSEILALSAMSNTINMTFLALGNDTPPLPTLKDIKQAKQRPTMFDITSLLRKGRRLRSGDDPSIGFIPFVKYGDLDPALILDKIDDPEDFKKFSVAFDTEHPLFGVGFSFHDLIMCETVLDAFYVGNKNFFTPFLGLDPRSSCTDEFTRFDRETVHVAISDVYGCDF